MQGKQNIIRLVLVFVLSVSLAGCATGMASITPTKATVGYVTAIHKELVSLPLPESKIVVAVYKFRDQTGQYKDSNSQQTTTFSTAVTQGTTSMLIKALEDSGWFEPIEREGLSNLLNEREIIRSTNKEYSFLLQGEQKTSPVLPPLMYAPIILEGGVISYETNTVTGGFGARYFGIGGSAQTRRDQVTVYLRAVSVKTGKILKSVSATKSILSREVDFGIFRFVGLMRLLEVESGLSTNEPPQMCVLEAIEKAVHDLIVEGTIDGIWNLKNPEDINSSSIQDYLKEKQGIEKTFVFDKEGNLAEDNTQYLSSIQDYAGEQETRRNDYR
ncbi:MAG: CsgG/HfaB family protein [bacterium]